MIREVQTFEDREKFFRGFFSMLILILVVGILYLIYYIFIFGNFSILSKAFY